MTEPVSRSAPVVPFPATPAPSGSARVTPFSPVLRPLGLGEGPLSARLAVYESEAGPPAVYDVEADEPGTLLAELASRTLGWLSRLSSRLPAEAVLAVVENLIHARFRSAAVLLMADGSVQVSDQGPGIPDKERALLPGFTTATPEMRRYIRGVGCGLPVARRLVEAAGGCLRVQDNLAGGTVVGLWPHPPPGVPGPAPATAAPLPSAGGRRRARACASSAQANLFAAPPAPPVPSRRQLQILALLARMGPCGPSQVARHLSLSLATAFRELSALEALGLAVPQGAGKRRLSQAGEAALRLSRVDP